MIEVKEDYSLKPYTTFAIDVKCRYFVESDEEEALRAFVADYEWQPSEVLILGGGSNFLFTEDFTGTVFYPAMQGKEVIKEGESGPTLIDRMHKQVLNFGAEVVYDEIESVFLEGSIKQLRGKKDVYKAKTIIVATGASSRPIGCVGEKEYTGKGVSY